MMMDQKRNFHKLPIITIFFLLFYFSVNGQNNGDKLTCQKGSPPTADELLEMVPTNFSNGIQFKEWLHAFTFGVLCCENFEKGKKIKQQEINIEEKTTAAEEERMKKGQKVINDFCQHLEGGKGIEQAAKMVEESAIDTMRCSTCGQMNFQCKNDEQNSSEINEKVNKYFSKNTLTIDQLRKIVFLMSADELSKSLKDANFHPPTHQLRKMRRAKRVVDQQQKFPLRGFDFESHCILLFLYYILIGQFRRNFFHQPNTFIILTVIISLFSKTFVENCLYRRKMPWQKFPGWEDGVMTL